MPMPLAEANMMSNGKTKWVFLTLILFLGLVWAPSLPSPKARAQRIKTVNHVARAAITLANTNGRPATTPVRDITTKWIEQ